MSENPTTDIDLELSAVTRSFSQSLSTVMMNSARSRSGVPLRQTKPATRRQLSQLSTGKLTKLMYTTLNRGAHGSDVAGESRRISAELARRGLHRTATTWDQVIARVVRSGPSGQGPSDVAPAPHSSRGPSPAPSPVVSGQPAHQQAGGEVISDSSQAPPPVAQQQQTNQKPVPESAKRDTATVADTGVSPVVSAAWGAVVATGTLVAVDELATAVDQRVEKLGVTPLGSHGPDDSAEYPTDDQDLVASPEAVSAAGFGAGAVAGEVGQALADQADAPGGGRSSSLGEDKSHQNTSTPTPSAAEGVEV